MILKDWKTRTAGNMSQLLQKGYNNYTLYTYNEVYFPLLEKVMKGDYRLEKLIVDKKTAYIAKINIDGKSYLYKKLYSQALKKKVLDLFRKDISLDILEKTHTYREMGFSELVDVHGIGIENKIFSKEQFLLTEYVEGRFLDRQKDYSILESFLLKLHKAKVYHGDAHPYNFILDNHNNLRVLDTKLKRIYMGTLGGHYDFFKFRDNRDDLPPYPYARNIFYWYCAFRYKKKAYYRNQ